MDYKNSLAILITSLLLIVLAGCDVPENPLRAQARAVEKKTEEPGREQETKYGLAISDASKRKARDEK
ncbi:MAG TPA: hypothetical protein EYG50_00485 [Cycloclasticus sp.]|jgi:uncharacterized lipoprotein|nr:hypothetical protein [Cycloclasticus sp.]HIL91220.1 hypothetical protein [Cycloclasticus sp.]